jgi:hypothetical protein
MGRAFNRLPFGKRHEIYAAQLRRQATPAENLFRAQEILKKAKAIPQGD